MLFVVAILIMNNDQLLRKGNIILEGLFKGFGHIFIMIEYVFFIPSLIIFAEIERCQSVPDKPDYYFTCLDTYHFSILIFAVVSALICVAIVVFTNLFINS